MVSRYLGLMGWDWVIIDMQHSCPNTETAYECMHVLDACGTRPLVRTSVGAPSEVQRALDLGARGVVVPMVNSLAEAAGRGRRGQVPAAGLPLVRQRRRLALRRRLSGTGQHAKRCCWCKSSTSTRSADVEAIMALPGVDGCFIGPTDLALSMGLDRETTSSIPIIAPRWPARWRPAKPTASWPA